MTGTSVFPHWLYDSALKDSEFEAAYAAVDDEERAWLKTQIARLHGVLGEERAVVREEVRRFEGGLRTVTVHGSLDWTVLLLGEGCHSAARMLAALMMPLLTGVGETALLRVKGSATVRPGWPPAVLVGAELAGQELAADLTAGQAVGLLQELSRFRQEGLVLDLAGSAVDVPGSIAVWRPWPVQRAGIWADRPDQWNWEALGRAQPDLGLTVWGDAPEDLPLGFSREAGDPDAFFSQSYGVLYVPEDKVERALRHTRLALCPGMEGCWMWPGLRRERFVPRRLAWAHG
jgi:hypothetical protein